MIILRLIRLLWLGWRFRTVNGQRYLSKDFGKVQCDVRSVNSAEDFQELHG